LGEAQAEGGTVYPLLYAPTAKKRRARRGMKRSRASSENIFQLLVKFDRLFIIKYKFCKRYFILKSIY
jgi:hypothetical protein